MTDPRGAGAMDRNGSGSLRGSSHSADSKNPRSTPRPKDPWTEATGWADPPRAWSWPSKRAASLWFGGRDYEVLVGIATEPNKIRIDEIEQDKSNENNNESDKGRRK